MSFSFRVMTPDDIPFGMELKEYAGWNQTEEDWRRFLRWNPEGCFVGLIDGQMAGTITTSVYEKRLAWIGMVLVHPSFRRRGLGSAMLRHALDFLDRRGVQTVKLDATDAGRKVYEPLGFVAEVPMERLQGQGATFQQDIAPMTEADIERLGAWDACRFGVNRTEYLRLLRQGFPNGCFVLWDKENLLGFVMVRPGAWAMQIGPLVAQDLNVADRLLRVGRFVVGEGQRAIIDFSPDNEAARDLFAKHGFQTQRRLMRMRRGPNLAWDLQATFAIAGFETG